MLHYCRIKVTVAILMLMVIFGVDEVSNFLARRRRPQRPARPSPERCIVRGRNIYILVLYRGFCGPSSYALWEQFAFTKVAYRLWLNSYVLLVPSAVVNQDKSNAIDLVVASVVTSLELVITYVYISFWCIGLIRMPMELLTSKYERQTRAKRQ